jgi:hypothetical protein
MLLQAGRPRTSVASISVRNDRTFVQSMLTTSGRFFQYRRWRTSQRSGPCMASEMWMRSLLVNRQASLDAMFGDLAGAGSQTATQLGQAYPLDWQDCRDPTH